MVTRNEEKSRYEIFVGDELGGFAEYRERGDNVIFTHTEIDDAFSGQGLGSKLASAVIEDAVRRGKTIVPLCPFIAAHLRKHPEHDAHVRWPDGQ
ncbi:MULTISPECIES: GNAT family N-acetyltransferase [Amycolatopsis]|uniref:N-acetyltransferase n=1 Tax=Amycolatopsis thermalba TaxID=944492 RepID=A0ABY4P4D2_9PSEU|nr:MULTISPECIES: GNAT family N-acetyltransferase [Amycolatopsis]OXM73054.1 GNAT family N-acetyltransferase [Amycolatopsis sp. KNN50.9b]UQS27236.1 N-acetyltransferase [Amycolatopsis thermalba]